MSSEPSVKKRKGETMDAGGEINKVSEEETGSSDMFEDSPLADSNASIATVNTPLKKQNSDVSLEGSFTDSPDMFSDFSSELVISEGSFLDEGDSAQQKPNGKSASTEDCSWKGVSLTELRGNTIYAQLPNVKPSRSHTVLCQVSSNPLPPQSDAWDNDHVRMPFSPQSLYPVTATNGETNLCCRWELIQQALSKSITTSKQLEAAILSYNSRYSSRWDFSGLHHFFSEVLEPPEVRCFFNDLLPSIIQLALQLPALINHPVPLLRQHQNHSISLSQLQIASLLANALLCTFPRRNTAKQGSEYASFPDINFNRLYGQHNKKSGHRGFEKLKCIFHYFRRILHKAPEGVVTFSRQYISPNYSPDWERSSRTFMKFHISSAGTIEDEGYGMLQMDFANKRIGGGVLGWGCVQEEIRFVICPELIIARLFTESLDSTESLLITGCERFSDYTGYADSFQWAGDHSDKTPLDSSSRRLCSIVAIDATALRFPSIQFQPKNLRRELNKAYVGFKNPGIPLEELAAVSTGNWGCGAYRGNSRLKALLQLMAAAQAGRHLAYFTFGDKDLCDDVFDMYTFLKTVGTTVGQLWTILCLYYDRCYHNGKWTEELYPFIKQMIDPSFTPAKTSNKGNDKQTPTSSKDHKIKNKDGKSPRKQTTSPERNSEKQLSHYFPKKESQSSSGFQKVSGRESLYTSKKKDMEKNISKEPVNDSRPDKSRSPKQNKKVSINKPLNITKNRDLNQSDFTQEGSKNKLLNDSEIMATFEKETLPVDSLQEQRRAEPSSAAASSHRASLLESLELYDNKASSEPKRKISDYFSVVSVSK